MLLKTFRELTAELPEDMEILSKNHVDNGNARSIQDQIKFEDLISAFDGDGYKFHSYAPVESGGKSYIILTSSF